MSKSDMIQDLLKIDNSEDAALMLESLDLEEITELHDNTIDPEALEIIKQ